VLDANYNKTSGAADRPRPPDSDPGTTEPIILKDHLPEPSDSADWFDRIVISTMTDPSIFLQGLPAPRLKGTERISMLESENQEKDQGIQAASLSGSTFLFARGDNIQPASQPASEAV
jgi:hypothetical protein